MKTIGDLIQEARLSKQYSREELGEITHIRTGFISAIEKADWETLPEFAVTLGFVKSIAHFLDMDELQATSVFKRDYPPKLKGFLDFARNDNKGPKTKEIGKRFMWGPRMTFLAGVIIVVAIVASYLGFQYRKFNSPPYLKIDVPTEGQTVTSDKLQVIGKTDSDATITVNNQSAILDNNGNFSVQIDVLSGTSDVNVTAKSRSGKETIIKRRIIVNLK